MLNTTMTAMMGLDSGMMMLKNTRSLDAPSISAASFNSLGMPVSKKLRAMIMLLTATPPGRNMAQMVFIRPVSLTIR